MSRVRFRTPQSAAAPLLIPLLLIAITALLGANGTPSFQDTVTTILCNRNIVIGLQVFVGNSGVYPSVNSASPPPAPTSRPSSPCQWPSSCCRRRPAALHRRRPARRAARDPDRGGDLGPAGDRDRAAADAHLDPGDPDLDLRLPDRRLQRRRQLGPGHRWQQRPGQHPDDDQRRIGGAWAGGAVILALAYK